MTNEKDREEARRLHELMDVPMGVRGWNEDAAADEISHIRAEAVKAEREKCVNYAVSWMIANKNTECMDNTDVKPCVDEILINLSDDQEANRG